MANILESVLQKLFPPLQKLKQLPLNFQLDADDDGWFMVQATYQINGNTNTIDFNEVSNSNFHVLINQEKHLIDERDLQKIFSMRSLNPEVLENGGWRFKMRPPVLSYLRKTSNGTIIETNNASEYVISEQPLEPLAQISFDPDKNLIVKTGLQHPQKKGELISGDNLEILPDSKHARLGKVFAPLQKINEVRDWLKGEIKIPRDGIPEFFKRDLVLLRSKLNAVLIGDVSKIKVVDTVAKPKITIDQNEPGWLDFQVSYLYGDVEVAANALAGNHTQKFVNIDEFTWVAKQTDIIGKTQKQLALLGAIETETGYKVPIEKFSTLEEFIESIGGAREVLSSYQEFLTNLTGFKGNPNYQLPEKVEEHLQKKYLTLYPHQRSGIQWLDWLRSNYLHGILADDMGLGKTIQAILALSLAYKSNNVQRHSLILCPKSVLVHWEREIERVAPNLNPHIYHGFGKNNRLWNSTQPIIFISTYDTVRNEVDVIQQQPLFYLILDEATTIKNPEAKRSKAIKDLNATHRIAMTGTPIENRPSEMWSIFDFLMRGHLGTYGEFVRKVERPILEENDAVAKEKLGKRIGPFILRRLKEKVAKDLPEKIEMDEWCELTPEQRKLYIAIQNDSSDIVSALERGEIVNRTSILAILTKLKQVCDHPALINKIANPLFGRSEKFDWILEKIKDIRSYNEKVVVFSHYLEMLSLIQEALNTSGIPFVRIDGQTSNRQLVIDKFNNGNAEVALCSLQAAGYGITMTAANHVIHADRWWNPAIENQATDRVHRIGQDKIVYVYRILIQNTLEEKIDRLLARKQSISDTILDHAQQGNLEWSREELLEILRPI